MTVGADMPKLISGACAQEESQGACDHLLAGDYWDRSDKASWDVRLKLLIVALAAAVRIPAESDRPSLFDSERRQWHGTTASRTRGETQ